MAISGQANINIGNVNSPIGSDTLYNAFHTVQNNFTTLFTVASPIASITGANGVYVNSLSNGASTNYVIENTGVTQLIAGNNVTISNISGGASGNGVLVINATGGNGSGSGVTSIGVQPVSNTRLVTTNTPIVSSGNISIDLASVSGVSGNYTNPNVTIDGYGRVTAVSNGVSSGVTSVALSGGNGISIAGGPITTTGTITVTNTGVTGLVAGTGIDVSSSNGVVTITNTGGGGTGGGGTVTRVGVLPGSNNIVVSNSPITSSGNIVVNLASNITLNSANANSFYAVSESNLISQFTGVHHGNVTSVNNWFNGARSRGTISAPTQVQVSDRLARFQSYAYTQYDKYQQAAALNITVSSLPASNLSLVPSAITMESVGTGNLIYPLTLGETGNVRIPGTIYNTVYSNVGAVNTNLSSRARGNITNPQSVQVGDTLYRMQFYGYTGNGTANIWDTGNYSYGGGIDSVVAQLPSATGEWISSNVEIKTVSTSNTILTSTFTNAGNLVIPGVFVGNGRGLSGVVGANVTGAVAFATTANSVAGANVSGTVAFATTANSVAGANVTGAVAFATTANAVAGANVSGTVASASLAGTVTTAAQPNITSVGVLSSLSVTNSVNAGGNVNAHNLHADANVTVGGLFGGASYVSGLLVTNAGAPATATSTGRAGQIAYSAGFVYICVATNTWRRAAIAAW